MSEGGHFLLFLLPELNQVQSDVSGLMMSETQQDDFIKSVHFYDQVVSTLSLKVLYYLPLLT